MSPEKDLHATVPPVLLTQIERAAAAERISVDELFQDAVELRLNRHQWQKVLAFRDVNTKSRGLTEEDVA